MSFDHTDHAQSLSHSTDLVTDNSYFSKNQTITKKCANTNEFLWENQNKFYDKIFVRVCYDYNCACWY